MAEDSVKINFSFLFVLIREVKGMFNNHGYQI